MATDILPPPAILLWPLTALLVVGITAVYRRTEKYPDLGAVVAIINTVLYPLRWLKIFPFTDGIVLNIDTLMAEAMRETGLHDFGEDLEFVGAYKRVAKEPVYRSQTLTNFGFVSARMEMKMFLLRRLQTRAYFTQFPQVAETKLNAPVFVFGLGRSGTTFVHRLLSLDPSSRGPRLWELIKSVPEVPATAEDIVHMKDRNRRKELVKKQLDLRLMMGMTTMEQFHEIGHDLQEECLFGLSDEAPIGLHFVFSAALDRSNYMAAVTPERIKAAYAAYKKQLQLLTFQLGEEERRNPRRWVLKCPLHINFLKELASVFPDAKLVWAHRHPFPTATSACSLLRAMHELYFEREGFDPADIGHRLTDYCDDTLNSATTDIAASRLDCAHVVFSELTKDPVAMMRAVYEQFGWEFTKAYEEKLLCYLAADEKKRRGQFEKAKSSTTKIHDPEKYNLDKTAITSRFSEYIDRYNLQNSK